MTHPPDTQRQRVMTALQAHPPRLLRSLSRELGRNDAYLHQYLYRGTPRRLPEEIRHKLAILLNIDEESLRDDDAARRPTPFYFTIPFIEVQASAGHGSIATEQDTLGQSWVFHRSVLKTIYSGNPNDLKLLSIRGDSMEPILSDGDNIMVNTTDISPSPPGIFVLFDGIGIMAKRIELIPQANAGQIRISSANPQYSAYQRHLNDIRIIGRVIWYGRSLAH